MSNVINITERLQEKRIQEHLQQLNEQEQEWMRTLGYYVHFVFPTESDDWPDGFIDMHTHGLDMMADHPNFQIVLAVNQNTLKGIIDDLVQRVFAGERFTPGRYDNVIKNLDVELVEAVDDDGESLLRVILPDPEGNLSKDDIQEPYRVQYHGI